MVNYLDLNLYCGSGVLMLIVSFMLGGGLF